MKSGFVIAATCVALGLLAIPSGAQANILNLGASTSGSIGFVGEGGSPPSVNVTISNLQGNAFQAGDLNVGTYFLSAAPTFTAGPESASGAFPVSGVTEAFNFAAVDGTISGTVKWNFIQSIPAPFALFVGTFTGTGTGAYTAFSAPGQLIDLLTTPLSSPTLHDLASTSSSSTVGVAGGVIQSTHAIPTPLLGEGLPGIAAACVGLFFLARRRRRQGIV
jgi:hypothetical protein